MRRKKIYKKAEQQQNRGPLLLLMGAPLPFAFNRQAELRRCCFCACFWVCFVEKIYFN